MAARAATAYGAPMEPSQAVAPDLFDAIADPTVLLPLVMANAMSPRLWRMGRRMAASADPLEHARRLVDTSFTHMQPERMAELDGYIDLDAERRRLGADVVDGAIADIDAGWDARRKRGLLHPEDSLQEVMTAGRFPAYAYANVDVINAARRAPGGPGQRPRGLTSCLDEAALFGALLMLTPEVTGRLDGIALLASSLHYTVFGWTGEGAWWFWSKRDLFTQEAFASRTATAHGGDPGDAIDAVMAAPIRRVVSRRGSLDTHAGTCSLPADELRRTLAAVEGFFGVLPPGLDVPVGGLRFTPPSPHDALFARAVECMSAEDVQRVVRDAHAADGPEAGAAGEALLAFRSLEVADLMPYLQAARRSPGLRLAAGRALGGMEPRSPEDALKIAAGPAAGPALGDSSRLALPHEALARGSCSPAERGLLLHVLLEQVGEAPVRTVIMDSDAITRMGDLAVRASDGSRVDPAAVGTDGPALAHATGA